jgi:hypothetical protein
MAAGLMTFVRLMMFDTSAFGKDGENTKLNSLVCAVSAYFVPNDHSQRLHITHVLNGSSLHIHF